MTPVEKVAGENLFEALAAFDGLETFNRLPEEDQGRFVTWIAKARDDVSYWARIDALVLAMRVGPLEPDIRFEPASVADASK